MAVKLISNYAKRLGLPGYSSHQFSVSVETELNDIDQINAELSKIYHDLQAAVDRTRSLEAQLKETNRRNEEQQRNLVVEMNSCFRQMSANIVELQKSVLHNVSVANQNEEQYLSEIDRLKRRTDAS